MAVFSLVGFSNPSVIHDAVVRAYGENHFRLNDTTWFVSDGGSSGDVNNKIGFANGALGATGIIISVAGYSGYASQSLWTWLQKFPEVRPNG